MIIEDQRLQNERLFEEDQRKEEIRQEQERKHNLRHMEQMSMMGDMTNAILGLTKFLEETRKE